MTNPESRQTAPRSTGAEAWPEELPSREAFIDRVWERGLAAWRDLPWRDIDDPYGVWISEIMLQQTQVSRVISYWNRFMAAFPTVDALAAADGGDVQRLCMGLGYYQRFRRMKLCADEIAARYGGVMPESYDALRALPGIGDATAAGIVAFAHNRPAVYLETNVRAVFIHELFDDVGPVSDAQLKPLVRATCPEDDPRRWYYALLDYGAQLKSEGSNPSRASAHYHRQSRFEGSWRQKRAWLLRYVLDADAAVTTEDAFEALCEVDRSEQRPVLDASEFDRLADELVRDGLITRTGNTLTA